MAIGFWGPQYQLGFQGIEPWSHYTTAKGEFIRKVEIYRESQKFRETATHGGFYSETDLKKPVTEGGLGFKELLDFVCIMLIMANYTNTSESQYQTYELSAAFQGRGSSRSSLGARPIQATRGRFGTFDLGTWASQVP